MEKLQLNKRTIAQMDRMQMRNVKGGAGDRDGVRVRIQTVCILSCKKGSLKTKKCC